MSSSNKVTLAKLCKQHYHVLPIASHRHRYLSSRCLLSRCLSSVLTIHSTRKAKQSIAFGLLLLAGILTTSVSAQTVVSICDRTAAVQTVILAAIPGTPDCIAVTAAQLAAITELDLSNMNITALQAGDFANLTGLATLRLQGNTFTTPLPSDLFADLPSDAVIEIDLSPFGDLAVALDTSGMITIDPADAFISRDSSGNDRDLSYSAVRSNDTAVATVTESGGMLTITAINNGVTTVSVTASDGVSTNAMGTITVTVEMGMSICDRTTQVEMAILAAIPASPACDAVTAAQLATITSLYLAGMSITTLQAGDFAGLTSLTELYLSSNGLTIIEANAFFGLTSLTSLDLSSNGLTTIEANAFFGLTSLTSLDLSFNGLRTIEANAFFGLTSLTELRLRVNDLTTIEADTFSALTSLTTLFLDNNDLSTIEANTFSGLTGLTTLDLEDNNLTTLEANAFSGLTGLTFLDLGENDLTTLEAGTFSGLTSLTALYLDGNTFTTPLPADIFDPVPSDALRINLSPIGDLDEVALTVGGTTTINVANAFISRDFDDDERNLIYTVTSDVTTIATASVSGSVVTITAVDDASVVDGMTDVTITRLEFGSFEFGGAQTATQTVTVTVEAVMGICDRTDEVEAAILAAIPANPACDAVQATDLANITELNLSNSNITSVQSGDFANLTSLATLFLNDNNLSALPANLFSGLTSLGTLCLQGNTFTTALPTDLFSDLPNTAVIEIDLSPIDILTDVVLSAGDMATIDLSEAFISRDPAGIDRPITYSVTSTDSAIATAEVSDAAVTISAAGTGNTTVSVTASDGVSGLKGMLTRDIAVTVTMGICDRTDEVERAILDSIPTNPACDAVTATQLASITGLSLDEIYINDRRIRITALQSGDFTGLTGLTFLVLHSNRLTTIEADTFSGLTSLTELDLSFNGLTTIEANAFSGLTSLTELDLSFNGLTTIEANAFSGLTSLTRLDLEGNDLSTLEANTFSGLTRLTRLRLNDNNLTTLEANAFSGLTSLTRLSLGDNNLITIEANAFSGLTSLPELYLDDNNLTTIEAGAFSGLTNLTTLDLEDNNLTTIEANAFSGLTSLTFLDLEDNNLTTIEANAFSGLTSLTSLNLAGNDLTTIEANAFSGHTSLTFLYLHSNRLSTIEAGTFSALTSLTTLNLGGNPFTTPLPADIFDPLLASASITIDLSPIGDLDEVALTVGGTTTINVANAFISRDFAGDDRTITYTATPADTDIATATESSGVVTITGAGMGATTVSVLANDGNFDSRSTFTRDIAVTVVGTGILVFDEATGDTLATPVVAENGGTDMVYVQLASAPASDVTLTLTSSDTNEGTVSLANLTFTAAAGTTSWDSRQALTVTAIPDDIDRDDTFTVNFAVTTGDSGAYPTTLTLPSVTVTVTDDDTAGLALFDEATGDTLATPVAAENGGTDIVYVELTSAPANDVTLTLTSSDTNEGTVSPPTLTFTVAGGATPWNTRQAVTVTAVDDNIDRDDSFMVDFSITTGDSGAYVDSLDLPSVPVMISDDDVTSTNITLTVSPETVAETAGETPITVTATLDGAALTTAATVRVSVGSATDTAVEGTDYAQVTYYTLTIPAEMTSGTGTFMLDPTDDTVDDDGETVTISGTSTGFTTTSTTLAISESGILAFEALTGGTPINTVTIDNEAIGTNTFYVQLASLPVANVVIGLASNAMGEGTVSPATLTFTNTNWNTRQAITVTAVPDQIDRDDSFMVDFRITSGDGGAYLTTLGIPSVAVTVTDDDTAGIALFDAATGTDAPSITTTEGATTDSFYVALTSQPTGTVTVTISGLRAEEHTFPPLFGTTLTFTPTGTTVWSTRQEIMLTGVNDDVVDGDQMYDLTLTPTGGGYDSVTAPTVSVTNSDDDTAAISIADMTVDEDAGTATLTVTLTPAVTAGTVEVDLTTTDGTATIAGGDYTALTSETLTFTAGTISQTLDIPISNDDIDELDETFTVTLDNLMLPTGLATSDVTITDATATVTITDDDTLSDTINLSVSPLTVAETADATTITVTATIGGTAASTMQTAVTVSVGGGTATSGTDYAAVTDFALNIPALSLSGTQTFMIDPTEDTTDDNNETVMISGTAPGFTTINPATLTIVEAGISVFDAMTLGSQISTITIAEASSDILYVQLASPPETGSSVTISVTSSATGEGTVTPATLTFTDTNWMTRQLITVTAVPDNVDRDGDTFMVDFEITTGDSANYTSSLMLPSVTVTVSDDDTVGLTVVDGGGVTTSEGSATPDTFTVVLDSEPTATVTVEITGLRAGEHSLTSSSTLTFTTTDWNRAQTVTLTGINDNTVDGDQTYDLTLTPTGGGYGGVTAETVSITNTDDDTATLSIADLSVDENAGTATLTVTLTPAVTAGDIAVNAMTVDGTATSTDYTALTSQTLTFTAGSTTQTLDIPINNDSIDEVDETFTVMLDTLVQPTGVTTVSIADSTAEVTIIDNDVAGIAVFDAATGTDAPSITTSEGATTDTFYVALESEPTGTVTVTIDGIDTTEHTLTTPASGTLTFDSTNWNTPRQAITITGVDDDVVDGDQTYTLTLTATGGGYDGVVETGSVTNTDDDTATVTFGGDIFSLGEDSGAVGIAVILTPAVTAGDVMVDLTTTDGTATIAGADYTAITSQTLTFAAGSTSETLAIIINDDNIDEVDENFTVMLDNLVLPIGVTIVAADTATIIIRDNDTLSDTINLSINPLTIVETADATTITVTATIDGTAVSTMPTTVTVSVGGGTATSGTDYVAVTDFTLTIPALSLSAMTTFMIDPTEDTTDDNNETVMISGAAPGFTTINPATLTIVEAGISVFESQTSTTQISTATIAEASSDTFYVELASTPAGNVTLSVTSSNAEEGTVSPGTLTFTNTNWNVRQALTVTTVPDNIDRDGDSFMVDFMVMSGDGVNYTNSLTLPSVAATVSDDDTPSDTINLSISPPTVAETAGATTITVTATLDGALSTMDTEVTVTVGDTGDTADEGSDYTLSIPTATLTLTIPALETSSSGTFTITPVADDENDNAETITISGTAPNFTTINSATLTITGFSREEQQVIEQTVAAQASSVTQVVSENIGSFLASRTSAPAAAPAPPAPDGGGGGDINRENFTSIDWQDWQDRFAKLAYEGLKRLDSDADMSLDWALKAAGSDGRLLMPLGVESLTLWAAGGRLKTKGDGMGEYDGGVNSFVVGVDTNLINNWLLGIAASYSDSQVDYTMDGNPIGTTEQNLFSVHPFLSHSLPEHGLTLWVTGGYGVGDIDFSHTTNDEATSDVTQWMAAGGIEKHIITNTLWQGALRLKGLWGNATVDATEYDNGVDIRKVESTFWRARMESEMGYNFQLPGANVRPYALIGGRWDHNDAIVSGDEWHIDIGGGVEVLSHNAFALNISVHTQLTDGDTEEDSIVGTGSLTYDIGHDRQGLQITLSRPLNNTSPAWDQHSFNEVTDKVSGVNSAPLTSELAYGWTVRPFGLKGALQTYVQNSFDSHDRHYAVGLELAVNALTLNFESGYGEADNTGLESMLKTKIRW